MMAPDRSREQLFAVAPRSQPQQDERNLSSESAPATAAAAAVAAANLKRSNRLASDASASNNQLTSGGGTKLASSSASSKHLSIEVNNNSIVQDSFEQAAPGSADSVAGAALLTSETFRMDPASKRKQTALEAAGKSSTPAAGAGLDESATSNKQQHVPSYTSIFSSQSYNRSMSPPQEIQQQQQQQLRQAAALSRASNKLRKQEAAADLEIQVGSSVVEKSVSTKKLSTFEFADSDYVRRVYTDERDGNDENNDNYDEDDNDESEPNEKLPFKSSSSSASKLKPSNGRRAPSSDSHRGQSPSLSKKNRNQHDMRGQQDLDMQHKHSSPHTKISFNDSRPPSFSTCNQPGFNQQQHHLHHHDNYHEAAHSNGKMNGWQMPACTMCNCYKCLKKHKMADYGCSTAIQMDPYTKTYTRTKSLHLMLKSIILVLLTLLLLMMFIGIIMASHYLPQVFDKVLNVSRSFNVTIAG